MGNWGFCICMILRPTAWDKQLWGLQDVGLCLDIRAFCRLQRTPGLGQEFFQQWCQQVSLNPEPGFHKRGILHPAMKEGIVINSKSVVLASSVLIACNKKEMQASFNVLSLGSCSTCQWFSPDITTHIRMNFLTLWSMMGQIRQHVKVFLNNG